MSMIFRPYHPDQGLLLPSGMRDRLPAETGIANFGKLSINGTRVRANASRRKAMSYSRMREEEKRLRGEIGARSGRCWIGQARWTRIFRPDENRPTANAPGPEYSNLWKVG